MLHALVAVMRAVVSDSFLEFVGVAAVVAGVWGLAGPWWALIALGVFALLKAYDVALAKAKRT